MDLTETFTPGSGSEDMPKTDFFDFVVSPPPHCTTADGVVSDEESFLHRTASCRAMGGYLQQTHEDHENSHVSPFIKETNNNTLTALPPVSTITGSLSHHHAQHQVRTQHGSVQQTGETAMDQSECDYWGQEDENKEQTCNILEDLNKYYWSSNASDSVIHATAGGPNDHHQAVDSGRAGCNANDRQNTDGAIYTLTVLNNEANSMDALDCCKSPAPTSSDSWSLRPNLDLEAILNMEPPTSEQDHEQQAGGEVNERFHATDGRGFTVSQYTTDDNGFVESKELCTRTPSANCSGDNNNDWKLSDQNLQEVAAAAAAAVAAGARDSAESLLRSALQGKLYTGSTQSVSSPSPSSQTSTISIPVSGNASLMVSDQQQQQQQQQQQSQQEEPMQTCTDEDLLLSQLDQSYRPGDYEKLKSIANEVVESYCSLDPVCNVSATTTVMYTLDPASGSLGTITLPANLGQVSAVTVVTAPQQDVLQQQSTQQTDLNQQQQTQQQQQKQQSGQLQMASTRVGVTSKPPKKYVRRANRNNSNASGASNGNTGSDAGSNTNQQQSSGSGGSPGSVQRKERSLHYCSICSKGFKDKYSVNVHIRTHTGEKPFACSLCGKSFRQKAHLAKHYQTHVTQKPASIQQTTSGNAAGSGNNENISPTAEINVTSTSPAIASRTQVTVDSSGTATCNSSS